MAGRSFASGHSCVRRPVPASPVRCRGARTNRPRDLRPGKGRRGPVPGSCRGRRDLGARGKRPRCIRRAMHPARDRAGPCAALSRPRLGATRGLTHGAPGAPRRPLRSMQTGPALQGFQIAGWKVGHRRAACDAWRRLAPARRRGGPAPGSTWRPQLAAGAAPDCCSSCSCSARSRNSSASAMRRSTSSRSSVSFAFMRSRMFL